ncbi:glycosyltransferase family 4 protein [Streptomyces violaceusniger]|uniref:Glycosyl transferase group 1 n=1 Tax=Streptomyces violaceusniger (strain Tu 4113) TaxID=653045 RepID=G2PHI9_STRV4|nr:glycosyltransferase family 4 protein [Streptomyces violaceusniger]AEM88992.1 glycosyl transferase group 1 [Streptomyces violaceusniger Tu 4113]
MRVVALVHFYPPYKLAGSETMLHTMLQSLQQAGHEVWAVTTDMPQAPEQWTYEGIRAFSERRQGHAVPLTRSLEPDVIVTHHTHAALGVQTARDFGIPSVLVQHNTFDEHRVVLAMKPDLTVFNTEWIARSWHSMLDGARWMVLHPPVWPHEHATRPGGAVTLVNLNAAKGVHIFGHLAMLFPDVPFLGVVGAYGEQVTAGLPPNVEVIGPTSDMRRQVWSRTRVLLMPSIYESYGMAAVEAMASGIPVIANPTLGLREALGPAGVYADRESMQEWATTLRGLVRDPLVWQQASAAAQARSQSLDPTNELWQWVKAVESLAPQPLASGSRGDRRA